jgi:hypothetical protein
MGKFDKIVSLLMSGYTESAADAFVDNAFGQVTGDTGEEGEALSERDDIDQAIKSEQ